MGGPGCGVVGWREKIEDRLSIHVRMLRQEITSADGWRHYSWPINKGVKNSIIFRLDGDTLILRFPANDQKEVKIQITHFACHLGGSRIFFLCPKCSKRISALYASEFHCRHCLDLAYACQSETKEGRYNRKYAKFQKQLKMPPGAEGLIKPKRMRLTTFERIRVKELFAWVMSIDFTGWADEYREQG